MKTNFFVISILGFYSIISCNTVKIAKHNNTPPYKPDTCLVVNSSDPYQIADSNSIYKSYYDRFLHSTNTYDIAFTESIEGRNSTFKAISMDTSYNFTLTIKSDYAQETRKIIRDEKLFNLIKEINKGYLVGICIENRFHQQTFKLLLRRKGETYYSITLNHTPITDFIEEDRAKIQNGYDLINYLRSLK